MIFSLLLASAVAFLTYGVIRDLRRAWSASTVESAPIVKQCSCGRKFTREQWRHLKWIGVMRHLELRFCSNCGSSCGLPREVDERDGFELSIGGRS